MRALGCIRETEDQDESFGDIRRKVSGGKRGLEEYDGECRRCIRFDTFVIFLPHSHRRTILIVFHTPIVLLQRSSYSLTLLHSIACIQHSQCIPSTLGLRVAPSDSIPTDERVHALTAKSLIPYITSVPNFWNVIHVKLFVK